MPLYLSLALLLLVLAGQLVAAIPASEREDAWRREIRSALQVPDPLPELSPQVHGSFEPEPGIVAERVTYGTQFGLRIPAILYRPRETAAPAPALIVVNGHGGDKFSWYAFYAGVAYARAGAVVLTYDPAGEGERNRDRLSGTRAHDKIEPPEELARRLGGLMVTDIMQAVSYLGTRPEVDPTRIAAAGYSMGSFILSLAGAVDTRLRACVLVGGGNLDGPDGYWDRSKPVCQGTPYRSLSSLGDRPAVIYALHAARGPTLIHNGLEDTTVSVPTLGEEHLKSVRARAAALRGNETGMFDLGWVPAAGHRPYFVTKAVARWLERHLDFPRWDEAALDALPETHIGTWASERGVQIDRSYATELREAGTRAIGTGVPGLRREELCVLPAAEWTAQKDRFIHESWLREARSKLSSAP